jgi:hypothetical protein
LIGLTEGTHISGNSLTVIINGICGSLNMRSFFYSQYKPKTFEDRIPFRSIAAMSTYGDDNIGTVDEAYPLFNIKDFSEFLAKYGQIYTMPDKESELLPYLPPDQFEFLKRFNVYHADLDCNIGALLDKSIFKSLHCFLRPKGCEMIEKEASAVNIDGAIREWFNHGEQKYEEMREKMKRVASACEIDHICTELSVSYKERFEDWKAKYQPTESRGL